MLVVSSVPFVAVVHRSGRRPALVGVLAALGRGPRGPAVLPGSAGENVELSLALVGRTRPDVDLGRPEQVTSGYHVLRAAPIAEDLGVDVSLGAAPTSTYFLTSALLREYLAVVLRSAILHVGIAVLLTAVTVAAFLARVSALRWRRGDRRTGPRLEPDPRPAL